MKVLIISHMYPHLNNPNSGTFVHEQVVELQKQGIEVVVLCPFPQSTKGLSYISQKWKNYYEQPSFLYKDGVPVYYEGYFAIPRNYLFHASGDRTYRGVLEKASSLHEKYDFDLIHAHVALPNGYAALRLGEEFNIPVVTTIHGQDVQTVIHKNKKCKEKVEFVVENSNATIFVSTKLLRINEQELTTRNDRSVVINNGLPELFNTRTKRLSIINSPNVIQLISISNLKHTKGLNFNLQALSELKREGFSFHYSIVGVGEELENLKRLVSELDLVKDVSFLGLLEREEVLQQLQRSDIFTMPSWQEGFGMVYIEAMSQGLPVIACKGEGIEDVITDNKNGYLVHPKDVVHLKEVLAKLLSDSQLRSEIGDNAIATIEENFTLSKVASKIINLYSSVIDKTDDQ